MAPSAVPLQLEKGLVTRYNTGAFKYPKKELAF